MDAEGTLSTTFMGITKNQFFTMLAVLAVLNFAFQGWTLYKVNENTQTNAALARQGVVAHQALCVYEGTLQKQLAQTQAYLQSDTNGKIFGFPRALFERSAHDTRLSIDSLAKLRCEEVP